MKITKEGEEIVVRIPLWQDSFDAAGEKTGKVSNIVGIIAGDEQGIAQVIELGYKSSFDYGDFIVKTYLEKEEFIKLCKDLDIVYFEYAICSECKKVIYGSFTFGKNGNQCFDCEHKQKGAW